MEIVINIDRISDETKQKMIPLFEQLIMHLSKHLNITSLESIVITDNFTRDIIKFQETYGLKERGHTDSEDGVAVAKVLSHRKDGEYKQTIFISETIYNELINTDSSEDWIQYIQHELAHIHDNFIKESIYSFEKRQGVGFHILDHILNNHADSIWSEYIANRLSSPTMKEEHIIRSLDHMLQLIDSVQNQIKELKEQYKLEEDIRHLFIRTQQITDLLFRVTANVYGFLHSLEDQRWADGLYHNLDESYYKEVFKTFDEPLRLLYSKYPNWNDIDELEIVHEVILKCWNNLGIYPKKTGEEIYIEIR